MGSSNQQLPGSRQVYKPPARTRRGREVTAESLVVERTDKKTSFDVLLSNCMNDAPQSISSLAMLLSMVQGSNSYRLSNKYQECIKDLRKEEEEEEHPLPKQKNLGLKKHMSNSNAFAVKRNNSPTKQDEDVLGGAEILDPDNSKKLTGMKRYYMRSKYYNGLPVADEGSHSGKGPYKRELFKKIAEYAGVETVEEDDAV